jgi:glutamine phosphoribosylpyrophosphate amidotransferase
MCGIWGFSGGFPNLKKIQEIEKKSSERGGHSFGFYGIDKFGKEYLLKGIGQRTIGLEEIVKKCILGIGHHRLATSSEVTIKDAQPLNYENLWYVHNGVVPEEHRIFSGLDSKSLGSLIKRNCLNFNHSFIVFDTVSQELKWSNKNLPLYEKEQDNVKYLCSKKI